MWGVEEKYEKFGKITRRRWIPWDGVGGGRGDGSLTRQNSEMDEVGSRGRIVTVGEGDGGSGGSEGWLETETKEREEQEVDKRCAT